ncbi:MAG: hypothetical protein WC977_13035 [Anaerovoracaceae bacterium]
MCDICALQCSEPGCEAQCSVHIGDYCTPRDTLEVRCADHPPDEGRWVYFYDCGDDDFGREPPFYMRALIPEPIQHQHRRERMRHYWVGTIGDICYNGACKERVFYGGAGRDAYGD